MEHIDFTDYAVDFRDEYASNYFFIFSRVPINQISVNYKFIVFSNLVRKNDFVSDLKIIIFVIYERSIDENE